MGGTSPNPLDYQHVEARLRGRKLVVVLVLAIACLIFVIGAMFAGSQVQGIGNLGVLAGGGAPVAPANLPSKAVEVTVVQRQYAMVPGSGETVMVGILDITGGQTLVTVEHTGGAPLLPQISMKEGATATFGVGSNNFTLKVKRLQNHLVGDDFAVLEIAPAAKVLTEQEKIEKLIAYVAALEGAVFIRNGTEYTPSDAADHMRTKFQAAGNQITTARQFIDAAASRSSLSGQDYRVRLKDGRTVLSDELLSKELERLNTPQVAP